MNGEHSLKKRYVFKLFGNLIGLPLNILVQMLVPRALGPKYYGDYNFLTSFFSQLTGFFECGTSAAFFTKLSGRPKEKKLVSFYAYFMLCAAFIIFVLTVCAGILGLSRFFLPGQSLFYIYLALFAGMAAFLAQVSSEMADAYGLTVPTEKAKILQKIIGALVIVSLFYCRSLNLLTYFIYTYLMFFLLFFICSRISKAHGFPSLLCSRLSVSDALPYAKEFYRYSHPLFTYSLVGLLAGIFDRWLLQACAGSIEQGFFSLSYQIGALCFLFTSAMTPLITREFSIAYESKDLERMAGLFQRYIPLFYLVAAFLGCFIAVNADLISLIVGGSGFKQAAMAVVIMAFFPIHQTYGQLSGSLFFATGKTALYRNIGIISMLAGMLLTYLLVAPRQNLGFGAGAVGLALKMVSVQFITVNAQLYFNTRMLKLSFWGFLRHQLVTVGCLLFIAAAVTLSVGRIQIFNHNPMMNFAGAGFVYTLAAALVIYLLPQVFGIKREDFHALAADMRGFIAGAGGREQKQG